MLEDNSNIPLDDAVEVIKDLLAAIKERPLGPPGWQTPEEEEAIARAEAFLAYQGRTNW